MASSSLNKRAVVHARRLIEAHQYVLESDWGDVQPSADDENAFLESHSWDECRAAEFSHKEIELAWHTLLQVLDRAGSEPRP